jgi:hypothetical protein
MSPGVTFKKPIPKNETIRYVPCHLALHHPGGHHLLVCRVDFRHGLSSDSETAEATGPCILT